MTVDGAIKCIEDCAQNQPPNEAATRLRVTDPVLDNLGYDRNSDIHVEAADQAGEKPDYALHVPGQERWYLEAKAWDRRLSSRDVTAEIARALSYVNTAGSRWLVVTNGHQWQVYDNSIQGTTDKKLVASAGIQDRAGLAALLSALLRTSIIAGDLAVFANHARLRRFLDVELRRADGGFVKQVVKAAKGAGISVKPTQVVDVLAAMIDPGGTTPEVRTTPPPVPARPEGPAGSASPSRMSLGELRDNPNAVIPWISPRRVQLPGCEAQECDSWPDLAEILVTRVWQLGRGRALPYRPSGLGGQQDFINSEPVNSETNQRMRQSREVATDTGPIWINTHKSAVEHIRALAAFCGDCGIEPRDVLLDVIVRT